MFGLTKDELKKLRKLKSPIQIQDYLDSLPINWEKQKETYMSPRRVLREGKAHCLEGALLAALVFILQKKEAYLLDLKSDDGEDHVIALYKINGLWGAISKTNHSTLRFRDPIYRTVRELALSYFHEYIDTISGRKTLVSYSKPFNVAKLPTTWVTHEEELDEIAAAIDHSPHYRFYPAKNKKFIRNADAMELSAAKLIEWKKNHPGT